MFCDRFAVQRTWMHPFDSSSLIIACVHNLRALLVKSPHFGSKTSIGEAEILKKIQQKVDKMGGEDGKKL
jgi:hypothetical protein